MKANIETTGISTECRLSIDLSEMIDKKNWELLRVTNSGLVTLFWEIGKALNQYLGKNKRVEYENSLIRIISTQLVANYGPYFTEKNVKKMGQFADQFPDLSSVVLIGPIISWEHILLLLQVKDLEAKLFYIRLTVEQGLSVNGLRKLMSANLYEQPKANKTSKPRRDVLRQHPGRTKISTQKFLQILQTGLQQQSRNNAVIKNVFKEPLLSSFRPLMEPSKGHALLIKKNTKKPGIEEELFAVLSEPIVNFQKSQNRWLDANLNLFFWEIGKRINHEILLNNNEIIDRKSIICDASIELKKKYPQNFSEKQLSQMASFAEEIADRGIASRIINLVRWEHILVLLSLKEIKAWLFYARLTAAEGLSIAGLRKQIAQNTYEQTIGAKKRGQNTITELQIPKMKTIVEEREGNNVVSITTIYRDISGDIDINTTPAVPNIFKNPYLPLLALVPAKPSGKNMVSHKTNKKNDNFVL